MPELDENHNIANHKPIEEYDWEIEINDNIRIGVYFRPHLQDFLEELSKIYEIYVFTASREDYANKIVNLIDPSQ